MEIKLQNDESSLIAYYFLMTNFSFLDEYDFLILLSLASLCKIKINKYVNVGSCLSIYEEFLQKLDESDKQEFTTEPITIENSKVIYAYGTGKRNPEKVKKLKISDNLLSLKNNQEEPQISKKLTYALDKLISNDMDILRKQMPNSKLLKKYMTLKKILLCKTPYNDFFYENIASNNLYNSYDPKVRDEYSRGIYKDTYDFIFCMEEFLINKNNILIEDYSRTIDDCLYVYKMLSSKTKTYKKSK